jgi:hypothetical protein
MASQVVGLANVQGTSSPGLSGIGFRQLSNVSASRERPHGTSCHSVLGYVAIKHPFFGAVRRFERLAFGVLAGADPGPRKDPAIPGEYRSPERGNLSWHPPQCELLYEKVVVCRRASRPPRDGLHDCQILIVAHAYDAPGRIMAENPGRAAYDRRNRQAGSPHLRYHDERSSRTFGVVGCDTMHLMESPFCTR